MADDIVVNNADATQQGVEGAPAPVQIDYEAELKAALAREAITASERDNYKKGLLMSKGKLPDDGTLDNIKREAQGEEKVDIQEIIRKTVLETASTLVQKPTLDIMLREMSNNPQERDLIKYHYEHSIVKGGLDESSVRADIEKAYAIANGKKLRKTVSEMQVAMQNREQISNISGGSSQESQQEVKPSFWTPEQLDEFKKRGVNPDKVKANYLKNQGKIK